jgi:general secretion pathway protein H
MRRVGDRGFTLLEIMVVVAIIGIFIGVTVLSTDLVSFERRLEQQANRMGPLVSFATDEALLQSQDFGILICERSYHFFIYDYELEDWIPYAMRPFDAHGLEPDMIMSLTIDDREVILETAEEAFPPEWNMPPTEAELERMPDPQILILSSGEITPFRLDFLRESEPLDPGARLDVAFDGEWEVTTGEL